VGRKALVTAATAVALLAAVGVTNAAWAGTHRRGGHGRGGHATPSPSISAPASPTATRSAAPTTAPPAASSAAATPAAPTATAPGTPVTGKTLFDDFSYTSSSDAKLATNGWSVRTGGGGPGISGATWSKSAVTFPADPANPTNRIMQLAASTTGTAGGTVQAEVNTTAKKFFAGTYAARVFFNDAPASGTDGDAINETFFTITPLRYDDDPIYSELDFEYLPNGGWGAKVPTMYLTTWYSYHNSPAWGGDRVSGESARSLQGWHDLVMQVGGGTVTYFIDGAKVFSSNGRYYPRQTMAIDFNEWFIEGGLIGGSGTRTYHQQVDWVYHVANQVVAADAQAGQHVPVRRGPSRTLSLGDLRSGLAAVPGPPPGPGYGPARPTSGRAVAG
jgi:hypothetical protein